MPARRLVLFALLSSAGLVAAGCGGEPVGDLTGSVSLNGFPVKAAQVAAFNEKGELVAQVTAFEGKYRITGVPLGPVTLVVQTHLPDGSPVTAPKFPGRDVEQPGDRKGDGGAVGLPTALDPVPLKYTSPKQSGLQVTVVRGTTTYDIAMTGRGEIPKAPPPPGLGGVPFTPPKG
jgi:hypothetical protein